MELVKYTGPSIDHNPTDCSNDLQLDGLHLPGLDEHDSETLCGACWSGAPHEAEYDDKPTCRTCISIAKTLFKRYTKKQVESW